MKLEKKRYEDIVILKFTGELEAFNLPPFTERMEAWIDAGDVRFIFDLRLLTFINSSAFGYMMRLRKVLADRGGGLVIARPSKFIRKTLKTYGVEDILPAYESVEDAILYFKKGADVGRLTLDTTESEEALKGEVPLLFRPLADEGEAPPNQVGRIVSLYDDGLLFHYEAGRGLDPVELNVAVGTRLKLKFRQPFLVKDRYFEMDAKVTHVDTVEEASAEDVRVLAVRTEYDRIADQDRADLERFVRDQDEWRREIGRQ